MSKSKEDLKAPATIMGMHWGLFLGVAVITFGAAYIGIMPGGILFIALMSLALGHSLNFIGDRIPIFNTYLGGGIMLALIGSAILKYLNLLPSPFTETLVLDLLTKGGYFDLLITPLVVGSIMGLNRNLLVKTGARYIVPIATGILFSFLGTGAIGAIFGYGFKETILYVVAPIMGGGMGAGAIPMAEMYEAAGVVEPGTVLSILTVSLTVGNIIAVIIGSVLNTVGKKYPKLTGNGFLMEDEQIIEKRETVTSILLNNIAPGIAVSACFYLLARLLGRIIPLHPYAILVFMMVAVKISNIVPEKIGEQLNTFFLITIKFLLLSVIPIIGLNLINIPDILSSFSSPVFLILIVLTVILGALGAGLGGIAVKFFFIESAISAGLCMANTGGSQDVTVLAAAKRWELMPFATISSRLGGAIILLIMGVLVRIF